MKTITRSLSACIPIRLNPLLGPETSILYNTTTYRRDKMYVLPQQAVLTWIVSTHSELFSNCRVTSINFESIMLQFASLEKYIQCKPT